MRKPKFLLVSFINLHQLKIEWVDLFFVRKHPDFSNRASPRPTHLPTSVSHKPPATTMSSLPFAYAPPPFTMCVALLSPRLLTTFPAVVVFRGVEGGGYRRRMMVRLSVCLRACECVSARVCGCRAFGVRSINRAARPPDNHSLPVTTRNMLKFAIVVRYFFIIFFFRNCLLKNLLKSRFYLKRPGFRSLLTCILILFYGFSCQVLRQLLTKSKIWPDRHLN